MVGAWRRRWCVKVVVPLGISWATYGWDLTVYLKTKKRSGRLLKDMEKQLREKEEQEEGWDLHVRWRKTMKKDRFRFRHLLPFSLMVIHSLFSPFCYKRSFSRSLFPFPPDVELTPLRWCGGGKKRRGEENKKETVRWKLRVGKIVARGPHDKKCSSGEK